ncbi:hypothetical protein BDZ97DRAFT_740111 [Flammula alnicola]|nr:hypothetical protein BDZ97DRAFT_740111 [Flammula alnicola]
MVAVQIIKLSLPRLWAQLTLHRSRKRNQGIRRRLKSYRKCRQLILLPCTSSLRRLRYLRRAVIPSPSQSPISAPTPKRSSPRSLRVLRNGRDSRSRLCRLPSPPRPIPVTPPPEYPSMKVEESYAIIISAAIQKSPVQSPIMPRSPVKQQSSTSAGLLLDTFTLLYQ